MAEKPIHAWYSETQKKVILENKIIKNDKNDNFQTKLPHYIDFEGNTHCVTMIHYSINHIAKFTDLKYLGLMEKFSHMG